MVEDVNPHGLPMWLVTSVTLVKCNKYPKAWWFEIETKEGVDILVGEDQRGEAEVDVCGPNHPNRFYRGELAAERVAAYQKLWRDLCDEGGVDPTQERKILLSG